MKAVVSFVWDFLGLGSHSEGDFARVVWIFVGKKREKVWIVAFLCIFGNLWKERNRMLFENEEISIWSLKGMFFSQLLFWVKLYINDGLVALMDFVE